MKLVKSVSGVSLYAWERNTLLAEQSQAVPRRLDVKFHWSANSLNDSNQVVDHDVLTAFSQMVGELFTNTIVAWNKCAADVEHLTNHRAKYETVRYLISPYNPTLENLSGMIFAIMLRISSVMNYNNSEDPDIAFEAVTITDVDNGLEVHFRIDDFTNGNFFNGGEFEWAEAVVNSDSLVALPMDKLFTDEFRIDIPKPTATVNPYE